MGKKLKIIIITIILVFSFSCNLFTQPEAPAAESTATATAVSQVPETEGPAEERTATPMVIPPATSLNPDGPYLVFEGSSGVWIANPDGGFLTKITPIELRGDLRGAISPTGERIAIVMRNEQGLDLVMVSIPGGETETITNLISFTPAEEANNQLSQKAFSTYAIRDYESTAWQPGNGRLLAFMGAIPGPTADLFIYDTQTGEIRQLTDGPAQAINPIWSPDGEYILHYGVKWEPPFGGAIGGANTMIGVWAARASDGEVITLPKPEVSFPHFISWQDGRRYLSSESNPDCDSNRLYSINLVDGEKKLFMNFGFSSKIVQSPKNGALMFSALTECSDSPGEGLFIYTPGQEAPRKLLVGRVWEIHWMPESEVFWAYPEALISADGDTRYDPPVYEASFHPAVSKQGYQAWEVIENRQGRVMVKVPGHDWQKVMEGSVRTLLWDALDGKTLLITLKDGSLYAATYPDFEARLMGTMGGRVDQAIWLP
ncbi:MAG: hypothetical protein ABFS03_11610 [Chloroflexota bacterium]